MRSANWLAPFSAPKVGLTWGGEPPRPEILQLGNNKGDRTRGVGCSRGPGSPESAT